jgi:hypothetical protein
LHNFNSFTKSILHNFFEYEHEKTISIDLRTFVYADSNELCREHASKSTANEGENFMLRMLVRDELLARSMPGALRLLLR